MSFTRRDFLKLTGMTTAGVFFGGTAFFSGCKKKTAKLSGAREVPSICPVCSMGCGIIASVKDGAILSIEGDPDHPVNRGALCPGGNSLMQFLGREFKSRLTGVLYRKPGGAAWEEITWDTAVKRIAAKAVDARERSLRTPAGENIVNRAKGIAILTGDCLTNEESYLISKFSALSGIYYHDHEGRLGENPARIALMESLGYGASTNGWTDLRQSDAVMIIGSNPVVNYPMSVKHIMAAKDGGGKVICADPRVTNTSTMADCHVAIRPGTDIAFIMGLINYAINNGRVNREYIANYTNAPMFVNPGYNFKNGLFSGYNKGEREYDSTTWSYIIDAKGIPRMDKTLRHDNAIYQILKRHSSRYTADKVSEITGCGSALFLKAAELFTSTSGREKAGSIICSRGIYQHSTGTQNVRALVILQLLLGNIGIPGGGIYALPSGGNSQGAADQGLMNGFLPGYLQAPDLHSDFDYQTYIKNRVPKTNDPMSLNWLGYDGTGTGTPNARKYLVSLFKAWYGENARVENNFCFDYIPKWETRNNYSDIFREINNGSVSGLMLFHTDPLASLPSPGKNGDTLKKLEWLVSSDIIQTEISRFWMRDGVNPADIKTEVFLLPMALPLEKEGSMTNSSRWVQWSGKVLNPGGSALSALEFINNLFMEMRRLLANDPGLFPDPLLKARWSYGSGKASGDIDPGLVSREINGYYTADMKGIDDFNSLEADGSTACGNWLYSGSRPMNENMMSRRGMEDDGGLGIFPEWAWSWPLNRRILYNRAGVDAKGAPWNGKKYALRWKGGKWAGDVPDGPGDPGSKYPFMMLDEGVARIFTMEIADGPLPEFYEPLEGPVENLMSEVRYNPLLRDALEIRNNIGDTGKFPFLATTFNSGSRWGYGIDGKIIPWLQELMPGLYCEISPALAKSREIENGETVRIITRRGEITAKALITERISSWIVREKKIEMIAIADFAGGSKGANPLYHTYPDPVSIIPEYKSFLVNIEKAVKKKG